MLNRTRVRAALGVLPLIGVAALFGAIDRPVAVDEMVAGVVEAVPDVPAKLVEAATRSFPGFDTNIYPGDRAMRAWRDDETYKWVGYYLPAPCHKDKSWSGKRVALEEMGWGLAVIYVGQQTWDRVPSKFETRYRTSTRTTYVTKRVKRRVKVNGKNVTRTVARRVPVKKTVRTPYRVAVSPPTSVAIDKCGTNLVSAERGVMEARDAINRTRAEGFSRGTVIFLDIERMERTPLAMREYYREWVKHVLADGTFRPGIYAHTHNAELIYKDVKAEFVAAGRTDEPPFWIAKSGGFSPDKEPHETGHSFAAVWQGRLDIHESRNGHRLPIDVNVAAVPSPSTHALD